MFGPEEDLDTLIHSKNHVGVLRYIRGHKLREPELVVRHGQLLLGGKELNRGAYQSSTNILKEFLSFGVGFGLSGSIDESERLGALEQICVAAMDIQDHALAQTALERIAMAVGSSTRYKRLQGLLLESSGDVEGALEFYQTLMKDNPSNFYAIKRKYSILRATMKDGEARELLNQYLEKNACDAPAWMEMANTCLEVGDFLGAAFCYEELILSSPLDSDLHCLLAECYISAGGKDYLKLARKHMAQSLELNPMNRRAMMGLVCAAENYLELTHPSSQVKASKGVNAAAAQSNKAALEEEDLDVAKELIRYGADALIKVYKNSSAMSPSIKTLVQNIRQDLDSPSS